MSKLDKINYTLSFNPFVRQIEVKVILNTAVEKGQSFSLPAWTPGSYCLRDYAKHMISVTTIDLTNQRKIPISKIDSHTYVCNDGAEKLEICYKLYANDSSIRGAYCDQDRIFINGSAVFLKMNGFESLPIEVTFVSNPLHDSFKVATQLIPMTAKKWGWGRYSAKDYDELIDCPIAIANMKITTFAVGGIEHSIAFIGKTLGDIQQVTQDVARICKAQSDIFSDKLPFDSYLFILHLVEDNYGGLEHRNSSALIAARKCLPIDKNDHSKFYLLLLGLFSHEYFHAWHVKRIKPAEFIEMDLLKPTHSRLLWVFEGFTSYFDDLALVRSGVLKKEEYFNLLVNAIVRYNRAPGKHYQSLAESSFDAWTKFYFPNENSANQGVSYYTKGALVACLLDLKIRLQSNNQHSLIQVMQQLWENYGKTGEGLTESGIENLLTRAGIDKQFLNQAIYECAELSIEAVFEKFGLAVCQSPYYQLDEYYPDAKKPYEGQGVFGWQVVQTSHSLLVNFVVENSPAANGGIWPNDEVIAIEGIRVHEKNYEALIKRFKVGQTIKVAFFRDNLLKTTEIVLNAPLQEIAELRISESCTSMQKQMINDWLQIAS